MSSVAAMNPNRKPVAVIIGATSKWQSDGQNTHLVHGSEVSDSDLPTSVRWGVGGAIALKFASEGYFTVLTTRNADNAQRLQMAITSEGHECAIVELDLTIPASISNAFERIRSEAGDPDVVVLNAGYIGGRDLPAEMELLENMPADVYETAQDISGRGPFLVAKEIMPSMRERRSGSFLITNNPASLRGRKRKTGESLYYPRTMMRTLAQVLTEEYSEYGVHVAHVIIDGLIDSPGTRALPVVQKNQTTVVNPAAIAEAFYYLHTQDRSCWTHELQLTPYSGRVSY